MTAAKLELTPETPKEKTKEQEDVRLGDYSKAQAPWRECCEFCLGLWDDLFLRYIFPACASPRVWEVCRDW